MSKIDSRGARAQDKALAERIGHRTRGARAIECLTIMLVLSTSSSFVASLGSLIFWLLTNNKVVGLVSGAVACLLIWTTDGRFRGQRALAIGAAIYLALRGAIFLCVYECWDFAVYYQTGSAVVQGTDPYASALSQYPVNALALFGLLALMPVRVASALWYGFNIAALVLSLRLGQLIVYGTRADGEPVSRFDDAHVTLAVLLAGATTWALDAGQIVFWTMFAIYAGIRALFLGRQVSAGLAFAASSLKITTALPFFLLPFERRSWRVLLVFGLGVAALCVCLYPPDRLPAMARSHLANVSAARAVGEINDYSFHGPYHDDMLGLEHWLYCLGMRGDKTISGLQLGILAVLGLGLFWDFRLRAGPRDELLLAVLLCVYSCIFLYHRSYDGVILALPLLYCVVRARGPGQARAAWYKWMATGLILVLNFPRGGLLLRFADWSTTSGLAGRLVQIVVLPFCTWILLFTFCFLWYLDRQSGRHESAGNSE